MLIQNLKEAHDLVDSYLHVTNKDIRVAKRHLKRSNTKVTAESIVQFITGLSICDPLCYSTTGCDRCVFSMNGLKSNHPCDSISRELLTESRIEPFFLRRMLFARAMVIAELLVTAERHNSIENLNAEKSAVAKHGKILDIMYGEGTFNKVADLAKAVIEGSMSDEEAREELSKINLIREGKSNKSKKIHSKNIITAPDFQLSCEDEDENTPSNENENTPSTENLSGITNIPETRPAES